MQLIKNMQFWWLLFWIVAAGWLAYLGFQEAWWVGGGFIFAVVVSIIIALLLERRR